MCLEQISFGLPGINGKSVVYGNRLGPALQIYQALPIRFEANAGQLDPRIRFVGRAGGWNVLLMRKRVIIQGHIATGAATNSGSAKYPAGSASAGRLESFSIEPMGSAGPTSLYGSHQLSAPSHYFLGPDPGGWRINVPAFNEVRYKGLYRGIDLVYHGYQQGLEYDFHIRPGANPRLIQMAIKGASSVRLAGNGDLLIRCGSSEFRQPRPRAFQILKGKSQDVAVFFRLVAKNRFGFTVGPYDTHAPLCIDPVLIYSAIVGGNSFDEAVAVTLDRAGNAYVTGPTTSSDFPTPAPSRGNVTDVFIAKLNQAGNLVFATYVGGSSSDRPTAIGLDASGNIHLGGWTASSDFPHTSGAVQETIDADTDAFVAKLNPSGSSLLYSTFLGGGGSDQALALALDAAGNAVVVGRSDSHQFVTAGAKGSRSGSAFFRSTDAGDNWIGMTEELDSGYVVGITVNPKNTENLYASTSTGVFKSTNGGASWTAAGRFSAFSAPTGAQDLVIDPTNSSVLYVATVGGIFKSTDAGVSYQLKNRGLGNLISNIAIDPLTPTTLYAGGAIGLYKSVDAGETWAVVPFISPSQGSIPRVTRILFAPGQPSTVYLATSRGVHRSTNSGTTWAAINTGLGFGFVPQVLTLAVDPAKPSTVYAGVANFAGGVYKSTDTGNTWAPSNKGLFLESGTTAVQTVYALAVDPVSPAIIYAATSNGVYKTIDAAISWSPINAGLTSRQVNFIALHPQHQRTVYAVTSCGGDGFVARLDPTGTKLLAFTYLGGTEADEARAVALDATGNAYLAGRSASPDFPLVNPLPGVPGGGSDAFVTKLNTQNAIVYSMLIGGRTSDVANGIALDSESSAYIVGTTDSPDFPVTHPLQSGVVSSDVFACKLNPEGTALDYSITLGGSGIDQGNAVTVDRTGNAFLVGTTSSRDFPVVDPIQVTGTPPDAFIVKLDRPARTIIYAALIAGQSAEFGYGIALDVDENAYVAGSTASADFPGLPQGRSPLFTDGFIAKIGVDADLSLSVTDSRDPVMINTPFTYKVRATNRGPSIATGVVITDHLPENIEVISIVPSHGNCNHSGADVVCSIGNLAVDTTATITIEVRPLTIGRITNSAMAAGVEPDHDRTNNTAEQSTLVSSMPSISGTVRSADGKPLPAVELQLTGSQTARKQTDAEGFFQFTDLTPGGQFRLTPSKSGFTFAPLFREIDALSTDLAADFTGSACVYRLSSQSLSFSSSGGEVTIAVTAPGDCPWSAMSHSEWIKIMGEPGGAGNGTLRISAAPAGRGARAGRLTIAGINVSVWQEDGACAMPGFEATRYALTGVPLGLHAADFNNDGFIDVALFFQSNPNANISILLGDGTGRLRQGPTVRSGMDFSRFAVADFNGDGRLDVALLNTIPARIRLFISNSIGGLEPGMLLELDPPGNRTLPRAIHVGDFDSDGKVDLLLANSESNDLSFIRGDGQGGLAIPVSVPLGFAVETSAVADFNLDGKLDVIVGRAGSVSTLLGEGGGKFGAPKLQPFASVLVAGVADFNGDSKPDLVVGSDGIGIARGDGTGNFGLPLVYPVEGARTFAFADFNNDGKPDIVVATNTRRLIILKGDGDGGFGDTIQLPLQLQLDAVAVAAADFNLDAKNDLVVLESFASHLLVNTCAPRSRRKP
ncbi:MAG TPA: FG-GAP-like repeat-containing protein [Acidobacteriota bacterium]|jgi:uncharacterized repeat protein (TIGR01451 family)